MAACPNAVDALLPRPGRLAALARCAPIDEVAHLRSHGRGHHVHHAAAARGARADRAFGAQGVRLFRDGGCRPFVVLRVFDPAGKEVLFQGALDPKTPVAQGWLRASHRKLDKERTLPYRPFHTHDELQKLKPGEVAELDVEIWPTSIVVPPGYRIALSIRGRDYEHDDAAATLSNMKNPMKGCGPFTHDDPTDRPPAVFGGKVTLHFERQPFVLLPIIPMN